MFHAEQHSPAVSKFIKSIINARDNCATGPSAAQDEIWPRLPVNCVAACWRFERSSAWQTLQVVWTGWVQRFNQW